MADVKWIKINTDIFDNEKIQFIEELPESDTILVIWFKLLSLAGKKNDCGLVYITRDIPYDGNMLRKVLRRPEQIIKLALATFEKLNMIEIHNNIIAIKNWDKYQNIEGMEKLKIQWREASKKYREKQKSITDNHNSSYDGHTTDKNREDKKRIEKNITPSKIDIFKNTWNYVFKDKPINDIDFTNRIATGNRLSFFDSLNIEEIKEAVTNFAYCVNSDDHTYIKYKVPHLFLEKMIEYTDSCDPKKNKCNINKSNDTMTQEEKLARGLI